MQLDQLVFYLDGLKAFAGVIFSLAAITIYWKIRKEGDAAMSTFQLNEDEVLKDAHIILYANVFAALSLVVYVLIGLELVPMLVGNVLRTLYIAVILYVLAKWVRMLR